MLWRQLVTRFRGVPRLEFRRQHVREADYIANGGLASKQKVVPLIAMQTSESDDGLIREWTPPDHPSLHHIGYAVMWFILALMAGLYGWFLWKRN